MQHRTDIKGYPQSQRLAWSPLSLPQSTAELIVVHVRLGLALAPSSCNLVWVCQLKLAVSAFPGDTASVAGVTQQLKQKLPQLDLS